MADKLQVGQVAPAFALKDQDGNIHRLADYAGQWLVVYFYPRDDTPVCTREACRFRDHMARFRDLGVQVLGISLNDAESHRRFATKFKLPFPLLADDGGDVARTYHAYRSFLCIRMAHRHSFIIDPRGHIAAIYRKVDSDTHSAELIADIRHLQQRQGA